MLLNLEADDEEDVGGLGGRCCCCCLRSLVLPLLGLNVNNTDPNDFDFCGLALLLLVRLVPDRGGR